MSVALPVEEVGPTTLKGDEMEKEFLSLESSTLHLLVVSLVLLISIVFAAPSFGHGMDKPGPHGGYIKMPGNFHTELVSSDDGLLKLYLLDVNFQFPTTQNSVVTMERIRGTETSKVKCERAADYFACQLPEKPANGDKLVVRAVRKKESGGAAIYSYPLRYAE